MKEKLWFVNFYKSRDDPFMCVRGIPHNLFLNDFLPSSLLQFFLWNLSSIRCKYAFQYNKKVKEMPFNAVMGDLVWNIFYCL